MTPQELEMLRQDLKLLPPMELAQIAKVLVFDDLGTANMLHDFLGQAIDERRRDYLTSYANAQTSFDWPDDERIDIIGQNGNTGEHYLDKEQK